MTYFQRTFKQREIPMEHNKYISNKQRKPQSSYSHTTISRPVAPSYIQLSTIARTPSSIISGAPLAAI